MTYKGYKFSEKGAMFWGYVLLLALIVFLSSCGIRKTNIDKESSKNVQESKESSTGNVSKTSSSSDEHVNKEQNYVVNENTETSTTTKYDKDTGKPTESTTTTKKSKTTGSSSKDNKSLKTLNNGVDSLFNNNLSDKSVVSEKKKVKDVDADKSFVANVGGGGIVILIVLIVVGAVFLYFYLKNRRK